MAKKAKRQLKKVEKQPELDQRPSTESLFHIICGVDTWLIVTLLTQQCEDLIIVEIQEENNIEFYFRSEFTNQNLPILFKYAFDHVRGLFNYMKSDAENLIEIEFDNKPTEDKTPTKKAFNKSCSLIVKNIVGKKQKKFSLPIQPLQFEPDIKASKVITKLQRYKTKLKQKLQLIKDSVRMQQEQRQMVRLKNDELKRNKQAEESRLREIIDANNCIKLQIQDCKRQIQKIEVELRDYQTKQKYQNRQQSEDRMHKKIRKDRLVQCSTPNCLDDLIANKLKSKLEANESEFKSKNTIQNNYKQIQASSLVANFDETCRKTFKSKVLLLQSVSSQNNLLVNPPLINEERLASQLSENKKSQKQISNQCIIISSDSNSSLLQGSKYGKKIKPNFQKSKHAKNYKFSSKDNQTIIERIGQNQQFIWLQDDLKINDGIYYMEIQILSIYFDDIVVGLMNAQHRRNDESTFGRGCICYCGCNGAIIQRGMEKFTELPYPKIGDIIIVNVDTAKKRINFWINQNLLGSEELHQNLHDQVYFFIDTSTVGVKFKVK